MALAIPPPITTARLAIRVVEPRDLDDLLAVNGDPEVTRYLPYPAWTSMDDARAWYERMDKAQAAGGAVQFVVIERTHGRAIGTCLVFRHDEKSASAELGYVLARSHWGGGYMREALEALLDSAFTTMALRRIEAQVESRNVASLMLLRRLGFLREGVLRAKWIDGGAPSDAVIHGLLRDDWTARTARGASSRIAPLEPPYPPEIQAAFDTLMRGAPPLALFRIVARNPRVLQRMMAGGLLDRGSIPLRARELMILRTCARCGAEYEWGVHVSAFGAKAQWTSEELHSTVHGDATDPCWQRDEDGLVIRLADELHATSSVRDSLWRELSLHFAADQLVELVMLAGLYHAVSFMVNATGVERESFAPKFPAATRANEEACSS